MRTRVECSCGWTRDLSQFYAGKRIRCADCDTVLEVPGVGGGLYSSRLLERNLSRATSRTGVWLPIAGDAAPHNARRSPRACGSRCCGNSIFFVMIAVIVALNIGRILRDDVTIEPREPKPVVEIDEAPNPVEVKPDKPAQGAEKHPEAEDEF